MIEKVIYCNINIIFDLGKDQNMPKICKTKEIHRKYPKKDKKNHIINFDFEELNGKLDFLLKKEKLPLKIDYKSNKINYHKKNRFFIFTKAIIRLIEAEIFYKTYMKKKIKVLKKDKQIYNELKKTGCLRSQRSYLHLAKIGLSDLVKNMGGRFKENIFSDFAIATMLYDASFDVPCCRKYLKDFDSYIMNDKPIDSKDPYTKLFNDSIQNVHRSLDEKTMKSFKNYTKIEHISQLMSFSQICDEKISKDDLFKITFAKGGISALILMQLLTSMPDEKQKRTIYELGAIMQLIDDITDMEEDLKIGISTLPNQKLLNFEELRLLYNGTVNNLIQKFNFNTKKSNGTLDMLCWFGESILQRRYSSYIKE